MTCRFSVAFTPIATKVITQVANSSRKEGLRNTSAISPGKRRKIETCTLGGRGSRAAYRSTPTQQSAQAMKVDKPTAQPNPG